MVLQPRIGTMNLFAEKVGASRGEARRSQRERPHERSFMGSILF